MDAKSGGQVARWSTAVCLNHTSVNSSIKFSILVHTLYFMSYPHSCISCIPFHCLEVLALGQVYRHGARHAGPSLGCNLKAVLISKGSVLLPMACSGMGGCGEKYEQGVDRGKVRGYVLGVLREFC